MSTGDRSRWPGEIPWGMASATQSHHAVVVAQTQLPPHFTSRRQVDKITR